MDLEAHFTWKNLGSLFYRPIDVYPSMSWDVADVGEYFIAAAPNGGAVATWYNPGARFSSLQASGSAAPDMLSIFSPAGKLYSRVHIDATVTRLVALDWNEHEQCVVVFENGKVELYDLTGEKVRQAMLFESSKERIEEVAISGKSLAAVTRTPDNRYNVYLIQEWQEMHVQLVEDTGLPGNARPTTIALIDGSFTRDEKSEILLGTQDKSIILIEANLIPTDQDLGRILSSVPTLIRTSPAGKFVAVFGEDAVLTVLDTVFERKILEFDTRALSQPNQLAWCGEDALIMTWPEKVLLIAPNGESMVLDNYDVPVYVATEIDSARIYTATSHQILHMVSPSLKSVKMGVSTASCYVLSEAATKFLEGSAECDDLLRTLMSSDRLKDGIDECISVALQEWDTNSQRTLLQAASYGKNFDPDYDANIFVDACKKLRMLNALRTYEAGMPLTNAQLDLLGVPGVIDRLCTRHQYKLALSICDYLSTNKDKVMLHWACTKVRTARGESEEAVRDIIRKNLADVTSVSFADIAAAADSAGRRKLATMLLDFEARAADQVPIFLKMREKDLAMQKALESGDTDLVFLALLNIRQQISVEMPRDGTKTTQQWEDDVDDIFTKMISTYPAAVDLLAVYYREREVEPTLLIKLLSASARYCDAALVILRTAYGETALEERLRWLRRALEVLVYGGEKSVRASAAEKAACLFYKTAVEEQLQLTQMQLMLEAELDTEDIVDRSVNDTLFHAIVKKKNKQATAIKDAFKISDAEFWHIKVRALASCDAFKELWTFAEEKRSPIGYLPFLEACLAQNNTEEAKKYANKISEYSEKVDALIRLGCITEAAELAFKQKDVDKLYEIAELARTPAAVETVERAIAALSKR